MTHNTVTVNGEVSVKHTPDHEAELWKDKLLCIARADSGKLESEALGILDEMFNFKQAGEISCYYRQWNVYSQGNSKLSLCVLFINCTCSYHGYYSIAVIVEYAAGPFVVMVIAAVAAFIYSHKKVFPSQGVPWGKVISMVLYTPALLRCMDIINKTSLSVFHPPRLGVCLPTGSRYRELLSYYYREYTMAAIPQADVQTGEVISWYRKHAAERVLVAAEESDITRDELLAPPERKDEEIETYCPLCHEQYVLNPDQCIECGIKLEPYGKS